MFSGDDLLELIRPARALAVNDYEARVVEQRTGWSVARIASEIEAVVVTRGADGCTVFEDGRSTDIPAAPADAVVDPTGCGDAFRAGLLYGMARGWRWEKSARLATVMGAIKIAHRGGQNHRPSKQEIATRLREAFAETI
jgi:adenosine kinase